MRLLQFREVAESVDEPKVSIGPGECSLCGLQREDEIDWSWYVFTELQRIVEDAPRIFINSLSFGKL